MVNVYNDDVVSAVSKRFMTESDKGKQKSMSSLAQRGLATSPGAVMDIEKEFNDSFMQRLSELIPQVVMQDKQFQEGIRRWNEEFAANQQRNAIADAYREKTFEQGKLESQRGYDLQTKQLEAMYNAAEKANENWWQQPAGSLLGNVAGMYAGKQMGLFGTPSIPATGTVPAVTGAGAIVPGLSETGFSGTLAGSPMLPSYLGGSTPALLTAPAPAGEMIGTPSLLEAGSSGSGMAALGPAAAFAAIAALMKYGYDQGAFKYLGNQLSPSPGQERDLYARGSNQAIGDAWEKIKNQFSIR